MSILVAGPIAYDDIITPKERINDTLGGAASFFSVAASLFAKVNLVAIIGEDFKEVHKKVFYGRDIDLTGLKQKAGKTFRWIRKYESDSNVATTVGTEYNVYADYQPKIPSRYKNCDYVYITSIAPEHQKDILDQLEYPKLICLDTMDYCITNNPTLLKEIIKKVDIFFINENEARQLTCEQNLIKAAKKIRKSGPKYVIIKKGSHGSLMVDNKSFFSIPAYPVEKDIDPTGAGDTFAGGVIGYLASKGTINTETMRKAMVVGTILASYNVEDYSLNKLATISKQDVLARFNRFKKFVSFDEI